MVLESNTEFQSFLEKHAQDEMIFVPVLCDDSYHELNNKLCLLFIKILNKPYHYILPYTHNECVSLQVDTLSSLNQFKKYVFDKKALLNTYPFQNVVDIKLLYYMKHNAVIDTLFPQMTKSRLHITSMFRNSKNINKSIPVLKLQEECLGYANECERIINECKDSEAEPAFSFLNNDKIECLQAIEKEGIAVDQSMLESFFPLSKKNSQAGIVYSQYNIYTATGRPSNRFGNINFAALNKENGERGCFISRHKENGILIMHDYESYHLRLIADMVGYSFPEGISVHEFLGRQYFQKPELTDDEYSKSKETSFQILYGGIDQSVANEIPFFGLVQKFIDNMWNTFKTVGYVETVLLKQKFYRNNFVDMNSNKLFNFLLQNIETERNIVIMRKIQDLLKDKNTKLVLYLYDAFLFDSCLTDGKELMIQIRDIMEEGGKYPVKTYFGANFNDMERVKI